MEPITSALIATALGQGLTRLGEQLADKTVEPLLDTTAEKLRGLLPRLRKADDKALQTAVETALQAAGAPIGEEGDAVQRWLKHKSLDRLAAKGNDALRRQLARAIIAFTDANAAPPEDLLIALSWPRSERDQLTKLLTTIRAELAALETWRPLLAYADEAAQRGLLGGVLAKLGRLDNVFVQTAAGEALRTVIVQQALTVEKAATLEQRYRDDLVRELRLHDFRGIVQMRKDIRLPLADIYLELGLLNLNDEDERQAAHERILTLRQEERAAEEERGQEDRVADALARAQRLVILGEPGAGKSISLKFITLMLAYGYGATRLGLTTPYIPLQVRLADFARELAKTPNLALDNYLFRAIEQQFSHSKLGEFLRLALDKDACMLLLDGLDEVGDDAAQGASLRTQVVKQVQRFADRWCIGDRHNRLVVTSRIEGYWTEALHGFTHAQLSPLRPPDEIEEFLVRWYMAHERAHDDQLPAAEAEPRARRRVADLLPPILETASVRRLATNPLLLTILALIHDTVGRLPNRRVKLYEICAQTLIESWRQAQTGLPSALLAELGEETVIRIMAPLAYWLHEENPGGTASLAAWRKRLRDILEHEGFEAEAGELTERFLEHARREAGLLTERGQGQYGFFHLTFEEYLAAREIVRQSTENRRAMLKAHWEDARWREVILLAAGQLGIEAKTDDVGDFIVDLLEMEPENPENEGRQIVLAGRALADIGLRSLKGRTRRWVLDALRETMQDLHPETKLPNQPSRLPVRTRYEAGEVLDELGWLPDDLNHWTRCVACADDGGELLVMKYPVTNAYFARFVETDGYTNPTYWGGEESVGWQWRVKEHNTGWRGEEPITQPEYWNDIRYGKERRGYPVVGVSWYEASAFAVWLTALLDRVRMNAADVTATDCALVADLMVAGVTVVRLPTEDEWVRLAGGVTNQDRYPWDVGDGATKDQAVILARAHTFESGIQGTSPVSMYSLGASQPFGLFDVAGNIWEWTDSWYSKQSRVLRGGSWRDNLFDARCAARENFDTGRANLDLGLRLVSPISSGS